MEYLDFKMEKHLIDKRVDQMSKEGVNFKTGINVGKDISIDEIKNQYDAVVLSWRLRISKRFTY